MNDIKNTADIILLVNTFYEKVKQDDLIGPLFSDIAHVNWDAHLPKMYVFWESLLLGSVRYQGQPFLPHAKLNSMTRLEKTHFERWIKLFFNTIDELFTGEKAEEAKGRANNIAAVWFHKLDFINTLDVETH